MSTASICNKQTPLFLNADINKNGLCLQTQKVNFFSKRISISLFLTTITWINEFKFVCHFTAVHLSANLCRYKNTTPAEIGFYERGVCRVPRVARTSRYESHVCSQVNIPRCHQPHHVPCAKGKLEHRMTQNFNNDGLQAKWLPTSQLCRLPVLPVLHLPSTTTIANFADDSPVSEWTRCAMQAAMKRKTDEAAARDGAAITREVHTPASTENWSCLSLPAGG